MQENPGGWQGFNGLEPQRCEDKKAIDVPEKRPEKFGTFMKQALC